MGRKGEGVVTEGFSPCASLLPLSLHKKKKKNCYNGEADQLQHGATKECEVTDKGI